MRPTAVRNLFSLLVVLTVIVVVAVTAFRDAPPSSPSSPHTAQQPDTTREAPTAAAAPDREELLKIAAEVMEGKRPRSDLDKYGISLGETTGGDAAKAKLLEELRQLNEGSATTRPAAP